MHGKLFEYFESDHHRLEELLNRATKDTLRYDLDVYSQFRSGLLRHIGLEERILFPAAQGVKGGEPFPSMPRLKLDHGALTALMVPPPSTAIVQVIRDILVKHDELEESDGGPYDACETLVSRDTDTLLQRVSNAPAVPVLRHRNEEFVLDATRRAVARAGYDLAAYEAATRR